VGTPSNVSIGPGEVFVAPIGTTMPTTATGSLDVAFRNVGYTDGGVTFNYGLTVEPTLVDQELEAIGQRTTGRTASITVPMAEATAKNLALALNVGADVASGAFEPPDLGDEVRVIIVFEAETGARYLFRQCLNAGSISISNAKAPAKRIIATEFRLEKPDGAKPFKIFPAADGTI
jgi:hypothetical protein